MGTGTVGQGREEVAEVPRQPAVEGRKAVAFECIQQADGHNLAREKVDIRMGLDLLEPVGYDTEQMDDDVVHRHGAVLSWLWLQQPSKIRQRRALFN